MFRNTAKATATTANDCHQGFGTLARDGTTDGHIHAAHAAATRTTTTGVNTL